MTQIQELSSCSNEKIETKKLIGYITFQKFMLYRYLVLWLMVHLKLLFTMIIIRSILFIILINAALVFPATSRCKYKQFVIYGLGHIVWFQKISWIPPQRMFLGLEPHPPPPWNFQFSFILSLENFGF